MIQEKNKNMKVKVIDWINYNDASNYKDNNLGGMGGWFNSHLIHGYKNKFEFDDLGKPISITKIPAEKCNLDTFEDYLNEFEEELHPYILALKEEIINNNIQLTGEQHQHSSNGVPIFNDGTCSTFSYRSWGDLMAAIYTSEEIPLTYMKYYM